MRVVPALLCALVALAPGCAGYDPTCRPGSGPTDRSYHFGGVSAGAIFSSAWDTTRVANAMRSAGLGDPQARNDGSVLEAGNAIALQGPTAVNWSFSVSYSEPLGRRMIHADVEARANATIPKYAAAFNETLGRLEDALGERHAGNVIWRAIEAVE